MPTKEEMQETINELEADVERLQVEVDELTPEPAEPEEATVVLRWPHKVDLSTGLAASAFGILLQEDEDGYYAEMPASRAEAELGREEGFVEELEEE